MHQVFCSLRSISVSYFYKVCGLPLVASPYICSIKNNIWSGKKMIIAIIIYQKVLNCTIWICISTVFLEGWNINIFRWPHSLIFGAFKLLRFSYDRYNIKCFIHWTIHFLFWLILFYGVFVLLQSISIIPFIATTNHRKLLIINRN